MLITNFYKRNFQKGRTSRNKKERNSFHKLDYDWFYQKFIVENLRTKEIADLCNVCLILVSRRLRILGIQKSQEQSKQLASETNLIKYGCDNVSQYQGTVDKIRQTRVENGSQREINGFSISELADQYDISRTALRRIVTDTILTNEEILDLLKDYQQNSMTDIECILNTIKEVSHYNKKLKCLSDFYKPDFKLSDFIYVNCDGLYWHSELFRNKWYHFNMRICYEKAGRRIVQFRSDEIQFKFPIVRSMINNMLGKSIRVYARKTIIKEVIQSEATGFLNNNHIMGNCKAKHVGLYRNKILVCLFSYKIYNKKLDVVRFCSLLDHAVIGGFSKLLKYVEKLCTNLPIHYWVDLRYGTGNFLLNQGFVQKKKDELSWKWTDRKYTHNRRKCQANMDERRLTQAEHAEELGWVQIYDAGQRLYIKHPNL